MSTRDPHQLELGFEAPFAAGENPALWTPREIWVRLTQRMMPYFGEDRRIDYKRATSRIDFEEFATFLSMYSNSPDGGVIVFGADSHGVATGCSGLSRQTLNHLERCHTNLCPQARPEFKRIPVVVNNSEDFVFAIYIPYIGRLVETHKGEAFIRFGDSRRKMSEEEKRDFRSTRQELSFELEAAAHAFPQEFDLRIVQDFCDAFRAKEGSKWSNSEILVDRHLGNVVDGKFVPNNALLLLAGRDPGRTVPGCRVSVQRFASTEEGTGSTYSPIRDKFIEGNIVSIMKQAIPVIQGLNWDVTWLNRDGKFVTTPEYPEWAWLEALVNACVHRSYSFSGTEVTVKFFSDRLEIESPGGFVPPVNESTIYVTRATRNYHLMDALRILGYVRMAREGTRRIKESMAEWGLPDLIFR